MALTKVKSGMRTLGTGEVTSANLAAGVVDTSGLEDDIAILGFKVAANGSLAKYNLVDQTIDDFQDASGVDASASTNEERDASGKYYVGAAASSGDATGGTITYSGGKTIHTFTSNGNFVAPSAGTVDYLIVGGGGGAEHDAYYSGGGGAGGYLSATGLSISAATHAAVVGAAGSGAYPSATSGGDSSIFSLTADGGGIGDYDGAGNSGGSGGGGRGGIGGGGSGFSGGSATAGQGNAGGTGGNADGGGGGGGGSAGAGTNGTAGGAGAANGGNGGAGTSNSISGSAVYYSAGGGGGYGWNNAAGGAGPEGSNGTGWVDADNRGHGGSGVTSTGHKDGSSGVVIVSYTTDSFTTTTVGDLTLVSNATTAQAVPTKGDIVMTYTDASGTATLNTDLKAYSSRDNGTTYTQMTLASEGTTGGHKIVTAHDVDISSQPSGTSMRYKIETLNQSAGSKETRIQAVSLGWS